MSEPKPMPLTAEELLRRKAEVDRDASLKDWNPRWSAYTLYAIEHGPALAEALLAERSARAAAERERNLGVLAAQEIAVKAVRQANLERDIAVKSVDELVADRDRLARENADLRAVVERVCKQYEADSCPGGHDFMEAMDAAKGKAQ